MNSDVPLWLFWIQLVWDIAMLVAVLFAVKAIRIHSRYLIAIFRHIEWLVKRK